MTTPELSTLAISEPDVTDHVTILLAVSGVTDTVAVSLTVLSTVVEGFAGAIVILLTLILVSGTFTVTLQVLETFPSIDAVIVAVAPFETPESA